MADPIFGIATGIGAYYIYETDPRNAADHGPGNTLLDLISRRWGVANPLARTPATSETDEKKLI